jgi:flagellin
VSTTTAAADEIVTTGETATNAGVYSSAGQAVYAGAAQTLTIQNGNGSASVALLLADTLDTAIGKINTQTASLGIFAVKNAAGTGVSIQSASNFTVSASAAGVYAAGGLQAVSAPSPTGTVTGNALGAITAINSAVTKLGLVQGRVGTGQNQLQYAVQLAQSQITNYSAAESRIRDADVAAEAANLTKAQVLQQASLAALAQANSSPTAVLALLRG